MNIDLKVVGIFSILIGFMLFETINVVGQIFGVVFIVAGVIFICIPKK